MEAFAQAPAQPPDPSPSVWAFGRAELDDHRHELRVDGQAVALESKPYALLRLLVQRAGETLSKDELIDTVWTGRVVTEGVLAKCVAKLRSALGDDDQSVIRTVHGYGYRLAAEVSVRAALVSGVPWTPRVGEAMPARSNWLFVRELRSGGFGHVWLAEHCKTHEQRVFKFAADGAKLHALKREVTLYRLLHDSLGADARIVRIIDWNVDEPPYFVESEYIAGGNLSEWCEASGGFAAIAAQVRIEIVARIADVLAAAHSLGVLHKDLKPANVLIVPDGAACPDVRLVDFGSGRALEPERLAALGITRLGLTQTHAGADSTSGTPYYLAPELLAGEAPTVRADIYALGVILYQFLVGDFRAPLAPGWERDIDSELLREDIAAAADVDPERRIGDASELARRLRALPARAAERTAARAAAEQALRQQQQVQRWRASRRWLLAICAVLALAGVAITALYLREQREAAIEREVNRFLNDDLLAAADPHATRHPDLRVRDVLDRARGSVGSRFAGRPEQEAAIRTTLGDSYRGIGDYAEAGRQYGRALELLEQGGAARGQRAVALRRAIADLAVLQTRYADAQKAYAALLADAVARDGADSSAARSLRLAQAHLQLRRGEPEAAARALETLLPILRASDGADADTTLAGLADLGQAYRATANFDKAQAVYREVHDARVRRFGASHWLTLESLQDLAQLERSRGHLDEAVALQKRVVAGRERTFGRAHEDTQNALNELASMYQDQNHLDTAEALFREVLAVRERTLGETHENTRNSMNNLALALKLQGRLDEAEGYYRRALDIERKLLGADNLDVLILMHNLAGLERDRGRLAEAETLQRDVIERATRTLPAGRAEIGLFLTGYGKTLQAQKRYPQAAEVYARARGILAAAYGPTHARVARLGELQAALYREWGRPLPADAQ
jgi:non-specific serine/threonine protein kinase